MEEEFAVRIFIPDLIVMDFYSGLERNVTDRRPLLLSILAMFRISPFSVGLWKMFY